MPTDSALDVRRSLSTTTVLGLAAAGVAVLAIVGEPKGQSWLSVMCALAGLVPWALVVGGVSVPPWWFVATTVPWAVAATVVADNPGGMFPLMLALVWVTRTARSWAPAAVTAIAGVLAIVNCAFDQGVDESGIMYFIGGLGISWLSGGMLRRQERLTEQVAAMHDAESARRAADERAHLAREVHDVVAHSLTVVMLNVTGARRALASTPDLADEALARAEVVGRESLDSIREVMDLLREPGAETVLPHTSLSGIPRLVDGFRAAGDTVTLTMTGIDQVVDPTVELVAYRVVQESMANASRHAPGAPITVVVDGDPSELRVTVVNGRGRPGARSSAARIGLGQRGMAERVRAVGGDVTSVATPDGGWRVVARLPVPRLADVATRRG